ncbi:MAG: hypothetical protein JXB62_00490 [Pirellulales bacterium]|nr:hypothetical protein [Pirellulales bacterium]
MKTPDVRLTICLVVALALPMTAECVAAGPTFSIDMQGPTIGAADGFGSGLLITEGDLLSSPMPGPPIGQPAPGPFATGPGVSIPVGALGIVPGPGGFSEVDAVSYGHDALDPRLIDDPTGDAIGRLRVFFSVDEFAVGVPGSISRSTRRFVTRSTPGRRNRPTRARLRPTDLSGATCW